VGAKLDDGVELGGTFGSSVVAGGGSSDTGALTLGASVGTAAVGIGEASPGDMDALGVALGSLGTCVCDALGMPRLDATGAGSVACTGGADAELVGTVVADD
jgi:hypothetical protein